MPIKTCDHPPCSCQITDGDFCTDGCHTDSTGTSDQLGRCRCQHAQCQPKP